VDAAIAERVGRIGRLDDELAVEDDRGEDGRRCAL